MIDVLECGDMKPKSVSALILGLGFSAALSAASFAEEYQDTHACDEFAAHPADPNRWAAGVDDVDIIPGPAVKHCRDAVKRHSETARFHFQLGRALWANNRMDEGLQSFLEAEETFQYGPAYANLGDAYMYGIAGVEVDQELAVTLYQIADERVWLAEHEAIQRFRSRPSGQAVDSRLGLEELIDRRDPERFQK